MPTKVRDRRNLYYFALRVYCITKNLSDKRRECEPCATGTVDAQLAPVCGRPRKIYISHSNNGWVLEHLGSNLDL